METATETRAAPTEPQTDVWPAPLRITKLSEAIRAGALIRPQISGSLFGPLPGLNSHMRGSCAIGAAYEAFTAKTDYVSMNGVFATFHMHGIDLGALAPIPVQLAEWFPPGGHPFGLASVPTYTTLYDMIAALNDTLHYTREKIADYLEGLGL